MSLDVADDPSLDELEKGIRGVIDGFFRTVRFGIGDRVI